MMKIKYASIFLLSFTYSCISVYNIDKNVPTSNIEPLIVLNEKTYAVKMGSCTFDQLIECRRYNVKRHMPAEECYSLTRNKNQFDSKNILFLSFYEGNKVVYDQTKKQTIPKEPTKRFRPIGEGYYYWRSENGAPKLFLKMYKRKDLSLFKSKKKSQPSFGAELIYNGSNNTLSMEMVKDSKKGTGFNVASVFNYELVFKGDTN